MQTAGLYLRLSREDDEKGNVSQSIENQRDFLLQYCQENGLAVADIYIDDGYSGTNFNRPEFLRLLSDIEGKKIQCVLTKDLSRLGRDYILTGYYLERYFPERGIRYIAVNDNIDTAQGRGEEWAPFRAVFNDLYARDISKKVRTALSTRRQMGKFIGSSPPYGYRKDPEDKNHLLIREDEAVYVREIYSRFLKGESISAIARHLSALHVPTPSMAKGKSGSRNWSFSMVRRILTMPTYEGSLVSHMSQKVSYKVDKVVRFPKSQWLIIPGTHEGIVSQEEFSLSQRLLAVHSYTPRGERAKPLTGLVFCGDCGSSMVLWSNGKRRYFVCSAWKKEPSARRCSAHLIREDVLLRTVEQAIEREYRTEREALRHPFDRALTLALIERILISPGPSVSIRFRFHGPDKNP